MGMSTTVGNVGSLLNSGLALQNNQQNNQQQGPGNLTGQIGMPAGPGYMQPNQQGNQGSFGEATDSSWKRPGSPGYMQPNQDGQPTPTYMSGAIIGGYIDPTTGEYKSGNPYGPGGIWSKPPEGVTGPGTWYGGKWISGDPKAPGGVYDERVSAEAGYDMTPGANLQGRNQWGQVNGTGPWQWLDSQGQPQKPDYQQWLAQQPQTTTPPPNLSSGGGKSGLFTDIGSQTTPAGPGYMQPGKSNFDPSGMKQLGWAGASPNVIGWEPPKAYIDNQGNYFDANGNSLTFTPNSASPNIFGDSNTPWNQTHGTLKDSQGNPYGMGQFTAGGKNMPAMMHDQGAQPVFNLPNPVTTPGPGDLTGQIGMPAGPGYMQPTPLPSPTVKTQPTPLPPMAPVTQPINMPGQIGMPAGPGFMQPRAQPTPLPKPAPAPVTRPIVRPAPIPQTRQQIVEQVGLRRNPVAPVKVQPSLSTRPTGRIGRR